MYALKPVAKTCMIAATTAVVICLVLRSMLQQCSDPSAQLVGQGSVIRNWTMSIAQLSALRSACLLSQQEADHEMTSTCCLLQCICGVYT